MCTRDRLAPAAGMATDAARAREAALSLVFAIWGGAVARSGGQIVPRAQRLRWRRAREAVAFAARESESHALGFLTSTVFIWFGVYLVGCRVYSQT